MKEETVYFESKDGISLCGILTHPNNKSKGSVILTHGITVEKNEGNFYKRLARKLASANLMSLRFDFRGHGDSNGKSYEMTIKGEVRDLTSAVNFLLKKTGDKHAAIIGTSFGGGIAVLYTAKHPKRVSILTLLCPVIDYKRTFLQPETEWAKEWFSREAFAKAKKTGRLNLDGFKLGHKLLAEFSRLNPGQTLLKLRVPTLIVHGTDDSYVPFEPSKKYGLQYRYGKFVPIKGADHGFQGFEKQVYATVTKWILDHLED